MKTLMDNRMRRMMSMTMNARMIKKTVRMKFRINALLVRELTKTSITELMRMMIKILNLQLIWTQSKIFKPLSMEILARA